MRLRLILAYDGACFRGWQSQPGGGAVQDVVQEAMTRLCGGRHVPVHGAGRTDAGVHALGQVAHAQVPDTRHSAREWRRALNAILPPAVRILHCARASDDFHARYDAVAKTYDYLLWTGEILPPHWAGRAWRIYPAADVALLRRAAGLLKGRRDFRGFSANRGKPVDDTERHVHRIAVSGDGPVIRLRFEGDGFLYKMVRMLVAAMVRVAQGRSPAGDLVLRLEGMDCDLPRDVAPPDGLYLVRVAYRRREQTG